MINLDAINLSDEEMRIRIEKLRGPRGLLANWPEDVVYVVNGCPVTKGDILRDKRRRQERQLERKRRTESTASPCFVWTFFNGSANGAWALYGGWWLYIKTLKKHWQISRTSNSKMILQIMRLFPCGYLPLIENFNEWKAAFAETYHHPTRKRPERNGLAVARAVMSADGRLLDVVDI